MSDLLEGFDVWACQEWIDLIHEQHDEMLALTSRHAQRRVQLALTLKRRQDKARAPSHPWGEAEVSAGNDYR
jgi:hypothetical protein